MAGDIRLTLLKLYNIGKKVLKEHDISDANFDAMCILEHSLSLSRHNILVDPNKAIRVWDSNRYLDLIRRRASGEPLQYIIGKWEFMNIQLKVGPGVLIPREDTQTLVEEAVSRSSFCNPRILDLCAGSGAVSLGIASCMDYNVVCSVELYDDAIRYLNENIRLNKFRNIRVIKDDVLNPNGIYEDKFDILVSNPPYIRTLDIDKLQDEVKREPVTSLDGGEDGLNFYRSIAENWFQRLSSKALVAVEIGINQENDVINIFKQHGLCDIKLRKDLNGINRVVSGIYAV